MAATRILIDGVFFQLAATGIARVWRSILPTLLQTSDTSIFVLDRGGIPDLPGLIRIPFHNYRFAFNVEDSIAIQKICDHFSISIFMSTYFTSPVETTSVLLLHDMIPEMFGFNLRSRAWQEKQIAILSAAHIVCVSEATRRDLVRFYPDIESDRLSVCPNGVDHNVFVPKDEADVRSFRRRHAIETPYVLLVGSRRQHMDYKNAKLLYETIANSQTVPDFQIICSGGENPISLEEHRWLDGKAKIARFQFEDDELACAYSGARALVYPSLYEGFGLPVLEAMACGCPVITTACGSLPEVAGNAAIIVDPRSTKDLGVALERVRQAEVRSSLQQKGFKQASKFNWEMLGEHLGLIALGLNNGEKTALPMISNLAGLRRLQASVDTLLYPEG